MTEQIRQMKQKFADKTRNAWRSATIQFNVMLLALLPLFELMMTDLPQLAQFLPDNIYKWVGLVSVVGNIFFRYKTSRPLEAR